MTESGSRSTSSRSSATEPKRPRRSSRSAPKAEHPAPAFSASQIERIRGALTEWYAGAQRDLPWRRTRDPYRIWLSETMLQQTRVDTVIPYYERFIARFPDVETLADAADDDLMAHWAGLGYYSRARNLRRAAAMIVQEHGGRLPRDADALRALPGVGPYTAGAVRSIAFREPAPIVDGNVKRVLSRWLAREALDAEDLWRLAAQLVPDARPDVFNQAMMELGATVCTPRGPRCGGCPVGPICAARKAGDPERYPARKPKPKPPSVRAQAAVVERTGRRPALLVARRPGRGLLGGLWGLPTVDGADPAELERMLSRDSGLRLERTGEIGSVRHLFTHRDLRLSLVRLEVLGGRLRKTPPASRAPDSSDAGELRWCGVRDVPALPMSTLMKKALAQVEAARTRLL